MRILHTSDWHLGKRLRQISRLPEQERVMEEIVQLTEAEKPDVVLVVGDIFDNANPTTEAIELYYRTISRLANTSIVIILAGNHDSPDRIEAPDPLARVSGIIVLGYPRSKVRTGELKRGYSITKAEEGFLELAKGEDLLRLIYTPYANEYRIRKALGADKDKELRALLREHWSELANKYCDTKGFNILAAHMFLIRQGMNIKEPEDEKPILHVGASCTLFTDDLPRKLDYVALGHLHKMQRISERPLTMYSGSPLAYSFSEDDQQKYLLLAEKQSCKEMPLKSGKRLLRKTCASVHEALAWLKQQDECFIELTLEVEEFISGSQRTALHEAHQGLLQIIPQITTKEKAAASVDLQMDMDQLFSQYFQKKHGTKPGPELIDLFRRVRNDP